jgi:hypothetical protein
VLPRPAGGQAFRQATQPAAWLEATIRHPGRGLQDAMGRASPRTTRRYDRSRGNLDRSPGYLLAGHLGRAR